MTVKEYDELRTKLRKIPEAERTPEQKLQYRELWAESMIESIVTYNFNVNAHGRDAQKLLDMEKASRYNYLADYEKELGTKRLLEIIQDVLDDYLCTVHGVFEDCEGNVYHGLRFKSQMEA